MHWIYLIHKFHNFSWITEINELFHDILIYRDASVYCKYSLGENKSLLLRAPIMPIFTRCNINLRSPQNVSVKFQLEIPHQSFIIAFRKCLFWVKAETHYFCAWLFKCKWATAPRPLFQNRAVPTAPNSDTLSKNICLILIIMCISLKSCVLKPYQLTLLI